MSLSGLIANTDLAYNGQRYARGRRAPPDTPNAPLKRSVDGNAEEDAGSGETFDAAYYQSRLKADLTDLKALDRDGESLAARAGQPEGDHAFYDFFGNLSVLLISVRAGDLERARAAADALELEVMVEVSAGPRLAPGRPNMLGDLRHLLSAAQSGDEPGARAAARALARDVQESLNAPKPYPPLEIGASLEAPPVGAAAYDALMAYIDEDTPPAV